jgi:hypothetical protein
LVTLSGSVAVSGSAVCISILDSFGLFSGSGNSCSCTLLRPMGASCSRL